MICKYNCLLSKTAVFGKEIFLQTTYGFATLVWGVSSLRPVQPKSQNFALVPAWQYAQSFQSCQTPQRTVGQVGQSLSKVAQKSLKSLSKVAQKSLKSLSKASQKSLKSLSKVAQKHLKRLLVGPDRQTDNVSY